MASMETPEGKVENPTEAPEDKVENQNEAPEDKVENQNEAPEEKVENHMESPEDKVEDQMEAPEGKVDNHMEASEDKLTEYKVENHLEALKVENHLEAPEDKVENPEDREENHGQGSVVIPPVIYRCRKCRRIVATQDLVVPHDRGEGKNIFNCSRKKTFIRTSKRSNEPEQPECTSIFVEPMNWMESVAQYGCVGDKIMCMGCKARLGSFNWAGMRCSCGKYICPAFQLHKNRLDESTF